MTKDQTQPFESWIPDINRIGQKLIPKRYDRPGFTMAGHENLYKMLYYYFSQNRAEFSKFGKELSLYKGIMLTGDVGSGKTIPMMIFQALTKRYQLITSRAIVREFMKEKDGFGVIEKYSTKHFTKDYEYKGLCIDDLGQEDQDANQFGNRVNVLEHIILERYDTHRFHRAITHVTTNIPADKLQEFYGKRAADRIREMFNIIKLTGKSLRK